MQKKEIIFGAPGCGKTTYLLNILEKELTKTTPDRIAFISFTRKGVYEGLERAITKFNYTDKDFKYFRTLHSICFNELKHTRYDMLSKKDYRHFSKAMNMNFVGYYTEEFFHNDDRYLFLYFLKHNNYDMYIKMRDAMQINITTLKHIALNYEKFKKQFKKVDFTDLLKNTIKQRIALDIDVAIIDEAQDLTTLQWKVCNVLFSKAKRLYIAGDDDQAIYEWTGADVNYFLNIEGNRTILNKSWRLSTNLLDFAKNISSYITNRVDKDFKPNNDGGNIYYYNSIADFKFKDDETYYCLSRNNYFLKIFVDELKKQTKLFYHKGNISINEKMIFAIKNFEKYKTGKLDEKDMIKVEACIRPGIIDIAKFSWFEVLNLPGEEVFYYRKLVENKIHIQEPKIMVNTIHGVKGGEADNVILLLDITRAVYRQLYEMSDSELRVLYVACTRARHNLHIVHAQTHYSYKTALKEVLNEHNF